MGSPPHPALSPKGRGVLVSSARSCSRNRALRSLSTKDTKRSSTEGSTSCVQRTDRPARPGRVRRQHHAKPRPHPQHLLDRVPIGQEIGGAAKLLHVDLDDGAAKGLALDDGGRPLGDELALVDEAQRVAELGLVHVVGGDEDGGALVGQPPDEPPEISARDGVDARRRLVEEDEPRGVDKGAGQGQPLAVAAGQRARQLPLPLGQVRHPDHLRDPWRALGPRHLVHARVEAQVLVDAQVVVERELLRHVADDRLDPLRLDDEVDAEDGPAPPGGFEQAAEHAERRGFARPVRPEEAVQLPLPHAQVEVVDRHALAKTTCQLAGGDGPAVIRHRRPRAAQA